MEIHSRSERMQEEGMAGFDLRIVAGTVPTVTDTLSQYLLYANDQEISFRIGHISIVIERE